MYEEVMQGKFDNNASLNSCNDPKAGEILATHKKLVAQTGIRSTPFFYIKGQTIDGFDAPLFEKLLKD
jgi:protein-disulfide isomerase